MICDNNKQPFWNILCILKRLRTYTLIEVLLLCITIIKIIPHSRGIVISHSAPYNPQGNGTGGMIQENNLENHFIIA